jgi:hypothetical protein
VGSNPRQGLVFRYNTLYRFVYFSAVAWNLKWIVISCRWGIKVVKKLVNASVAWRYIFNQKLQSCVNFGGSCNGRCWYILLTFGLFYGNFVHFMDIWYILWLLVYIFRTKINLTTLVNTKLPSDRETLKSDRNASPRTRVWPSRRGDVFSEGNLVVSVPFFPTTTSFCWPDPSLT